MMSDDVLKNTFELLRKGSRSWSVNGSSGRQEGDHMAYAH